MEEEHSFVVFLEQHPELLWIARSERHARALSAISSRAGSAEMLSREMGVSSSEAEKVLSDLAEAGLAKPMPVGGKNFFYASQKGIDFLGRYERARKGFSAR